MELNFKLTEFEGPLDLLLHLIDKAQIAIEDIFVSDITEQYLEYVNTLPEINMESASEFLATAAMLLEIKSRRLLPKPPKPEEDEEDPEQVLIRRLQEYKRIKGNAVIRRSREGELEGMYFKKPQEYCFDERFELEDVSMEALMKALENVIARLNSKRQLPAVREIRRDTFTIKDKINYIRQRLSIRKSLRFDELFAHDRTRGEVVTTFMAMLELWKNRYLSITQNELFSDIIVTKTEAAEGGVQETGMRIGGNTVCHRRSSEPKGAVFGFGSAICGS